MFYMVEQRVWTTIWFEENSRSRFVRNAQAPQQGPVDKLPRSPDLTPGLLRMGPLKQLTYTSKPRTTNDLKEKVHQGVQQINNIAGLLSKVMVSFHHRLHVCKQNRGGHIEQLKDCHLNASDDQDDD